MRKKKTPEELAKEAEEADQDELTSKDHFEYIYIRINAHVIESKPRLGL